jgi:hypothetical protein
MYKLNKSNSMVEKSHKDKKKKKKGKFFWTNIRSNKAATNNSQACTKNLSKMQKKNEL